MDKYLIEIETQKELLKQMRDLNKKMHNEFNRKKELKINIEDEIIDLNNAISKIEKKFDEIKLVPNEIKKLKIKYSLYTILVLLVSVPLIFVFNYTFSFKNFLFSNVFSLLTKIIITITSIIVMMNLKDNYNYFKTDLDQLQNINIESLKVKKEKYKEKVKQLEKEKDEVEKEINIITNQLLSVLDKIDMLKKKQIYFEYLRSKAINAILNDEQVLNMMEEHALNDKKSIELIKNM